MAGEGSLDLEGGDVLARAADDVLQAIDEMQATVGAAAHRIPGVEPAVAPGVRRRRFVLQISGKETAARMRSGLAHEKLAAFFDPHFDVIARKPNAPRADMARLAAGGDECAAAGFGHCPGFDQREAEALF